MYLKKVACTYSNAGAQGIIKTVFWGRENLKEREKSIKKYVKLLIVMVLMAMLLFCLTWLIVFIKNSAREKQEKVQQQKSIQEQRKNEDQILKKFKENKDLFDTLADKLYVRKDELFIKFSDDNIKFTVNEKEEPIGADEYVLYEKIYSLLKCNWIRLSKNSDGNKRIEIYLESEGGYDDFRLYNKDKEDSAEEISPGWYYKTLWFT